jgi:hypothetical protein
VIRTENELNDFHEGLRADDLYVAGEFARLHPATGRQMALTYDVAMEQFIARIGDERESTRSSYLPPRNSVGICTLPQVPSHHSDPRCVSRPYGQRKDGSIELSASLPAARSVAHASEKSRDREKWYLPPTFRASFDSGPKCLPIAHCSYRSSPPPPPAHVSRRNTFDQLERR